MLKTYIGHVSPATIVINGEEFGALETGESIVVDDDLANSVAWPEENWQDGKPEKSSKSKDDSNAASNNTAEDGGN